MWRFCRFHFLSSILDPPTLAPRKENETADRHIFRSVRQWETSAVTCFITSLFMLPLSNKSVMTTLLHAHIAISGVHPCSAVCRWLGGIIETTLVEQLCCDALGNGDMSRDQLFTHTYMR